MSEFELLKNLIAVHAPTGEEYRIKEFLLDYINANKGSWRSKPVIIESNIQDALILVFGKPRVAVYAHMDTVGFTCRYENQLLPIGSPVVTPYDSGSI